MLLALASPAELLWGLASPAMPVLRDRWTYHQALAKELAALNPFNEFRTGPADAPEPQPIKFWLRYRDTNLPVPTGPYPWQRSVLMTSRPQDDTINTKVLRMILSTLRESEVPSLVYLAPVAPQVLSDPVLAAQLARVETRLGQIAGEEKGEHVRVLAKNPSRSLGPMPFRDLLHLTRAETFSRYLADEILISLEGDR